MKIKEFVSTHKETIKGVAIGIAGIIVYSLAVTAVASLTAKAVETALEVEDGVDDIIEIDIL